MTRVRLLHTPDLHIGADGGGGLITRLAGALSWVVQRERVGALLFTGDTFDINNI